MIEELSKNKFLVVILLSLAAIKFALLPLVDWQNEQLGLKLQLEKKLIKIESLVKNQDAIRARIDRLEPIQDKSEMLIFSFKKESEFKLEAQKQIEASLADAKMRVLGSGWQPKLILKQDEFLQYQYTVNVQGQLVDFFNFLSKQESLLPKRQIHDFSLNIRGQNENDLGMVEAKISIIFFMDNRGHSA